MTFPSEAHIPQIRPVAKASALFLFAEARPVQESLKSIVSEEARRHNNSLILKPSPDPGGCVLPLSCRWERILSIVGCPCRCVGPPRFSGLPGFAIIGVDRAKRYAAMQQRTNRLEAALGRGSVLGRRFRSNAASAMAARRRSGCRFEELPSDAGLGGRVVTARNPNSGARIRHRMRALS